MTNTVVIIVLIFAFAILLCLIYITFKSKDVYEEKSKLVNTSETYIESLKKMQELERAIKEFFDVYRKITKVGEDSKEASDTLFREWGLFSLQEVLNTKTFEQLVGASKLTLEGSLAAKFIPIQHEHISVLEVEFAGSDINKLIRAARVAPNGGQAEMLAFSKLQRLLSNKQ